MKSANPLLIALCTLSLVANAALLVTLLHSKAETNSATTATEARASAQPTTAANRQTPTGTAETPEDTSQKLWGKVASNDMAKLITNLKSAGFSDKMIRAIISSLVYEKYADRIQAARGLSSDTPYWKSSNVFYSGDKRMKESSKLYREMNKEIRSILGNIVYSLDEESLPYLQRQYGNLSTAKLDKLVQIQMDYQEMMSDYQTGGNVLPADKEKLKLLQKEQRADMEKLLSPEELFEYDLRNGPVAGRLRGWNDSFDLAEAEYRTLFPLYQKLEDQFPSDQGSGNAETAKARKAAEDQMQDQIKAALGDERYAEFKQSRDQNAYQENKLVLRLGLPLTTATQLVEAKKDYQEQTKTIAKDKDLTGEQKKEKLAALAQASQDRVTSLIGERGLSVYREYGGSWLRNAATITSKSSSQ